jgi:hypothetical protein
MDENPNNIYIHNDFEVYEEYNDFDWDLDELEQDESYFNFPDPAEFARAKEKEAKMDFDTPPPSPLKVIKQTFHPNASDRCESTGCRSHTSLLPTRDPLALIRRKSQTNITTTATSTNPSPAALKSKEVHIQKLLLFNAYPIGYVLLWVPGIMNRFVELSGHSSRILAIAQASTQFVGLANACEFSPGAD